MAHWLGMKGIWVVLSWPRYWLLWPWWDGLMYQIVTGVTSDISVPLIYLVLYHVYIDVWHQIFFLKHDKSPLKDQQEHYVIHDGWRPSLDITMQVHESFQQIIHCNASQCGCRRLLSQSDVAIHMLFDDESNIMVMAWGFISKKNFQNTHETILYIKSYITNLLKKG